VVRPIGPTYLTEQKRKSLCELKDESADRHIASGPDRRDPCFGVIDELCRRLQTAAQRGAWSKLEAEIEADIKTEEFKRRIESVLGDSIDTPAATDRFKIWFETDRDSVKPKGEDR
jgi:hypothetical protein